jgi:hypothetical protein
MMQPTTHKTKMQMQLSLFGTRSRPILTLLMLGGRKGGAVAGRHAGRKKKKIPLPEGQHGDKYNIHTGYLPEMPQAEWDALLVSELIEFSSIPLTCS